MKKTLLPLAALVLAASVHAQVPATPSTTTGTSTTTSGFGTTGTTGAKAKPLAEPEKKFFKEVSDSILVEQKLAVLATKNSTVETTKKAGNTINDDLKKIWEAFATLSTAKGATISTEVSKSDHANAEKLNKLKPDRFDKEVLKDLGKETKKTARLFEGSKTLQDPELKKFAEDWAPTVKGHDTAVDTAEKELSKKPK